MDDANPLGVALLTIAVVLVVQPLQGSLAGVPLNWVAAILVGVDGIVGTFQ